MHTTPNDSLELLALRSQLERDRLRLELTMVRVQIAALETLERFMEDPKPTGDEKKDKAESTARNRKRLAATQTLLHCRTAEREQRLAKATRHASDKHQRLEPNRASDGSQATGEKMHPTPFRSSSPAPSPLAGEGGRRSQSVGRMRGRSEPSDDAGATACPEGQAVRATQGAAAQAEGAGHEESPAQHIASHGLRPITDRTQTLPPQRKRSRYKTRKPKRPKHPRKRKR